MIVTIIIISLLATGIVVVVVKCSSNAIRYETDNNYCYHHYSERRPRVGHRITLSYTRTYSHNIIIIQLS